MEKFTLKAGLKKMGVNYLGNVAHSAKMSASFRNGTMTYCVYLAPWTMAGNGHNVCPGGIHCHESCLVRSGREKIQEFTNGSDNYVMQARIKKTNFFYNDRETFMQILIHEIKRFKNKAEQMNMEFSVRLNGTSDLSPERFIDPATGLNILQLFPDVQFYDYTKVANRFNLMEKYANYDITFSYDGYNEKECQNILKKGGKVAVVFFDEKLPKYFWGCKVVDANKYDMRYLDPKGSVMGLHYHKTGNDYYVDEKDGKRKFKVPNTPFVVKVNDPRIEWF